MNFYFIDRKNLLKKNDNNIVWSEPFDSSKECMVYLKREAELNTGDIIFHNVKGVIIGVSEVKREHYITHLYPANLDQVGYSLNAVYYELQAPIKIKGIYHLVEHAIPVNDAKRRGLYACNELLAITLLDLIIRYNIVEEEATFTMDLVTGKKKNMLVTRLREAQAMVRKRLEEESEKFKQVLLENFEEKCIFCDITLPNLLHATYIKPWKDCNPQERMDPNNGLLVCYNHSILYEQGYFTLDVNGNLYISRELDEQDSLKYGLKFGKKIKCLPKNKEYFNWHKNYVFRDK